MGARIRGAGLIVCAAMHPALPGDHYLDDETLYRLATTGALQPSSTHLHREGCPGDESCPGEIIAASGYPVCGDGLWTYERPSSA